MREIEGGGRLGVVRSNSCHCQSGVYGEGWRVGVLTLSSFSF